MPLPEYAWDDPRFRSISASTTTRSTDMDNKTKFEEVSKVIREATHKRVEEFLAATGAEDYFTALQAAAALAKTWDDTAHQTADMFLLSDPMKALEILNDSGYFSRPTVS